MANELLVFQKSGGDFAKSGKLVLSKSRYIKPKKTKDIPDRHLKYSIAEDLARDIEIDEGSRAFVLINGTFIAGDFIEALIVEKNWHVKELTVSTLSLSENNIDSLANLINGGFVDVLNLVVSDYFYSHERRNLIPYAYKELDKDDKFQLAAAGTHCKLTMIETHCGKKITIHGSANLRSSSNIEHLCIEEGAELYNFNMEVQRSILEIHKTINKSVRYETLWQAVQK